jgi:hypothetical protein
MAGQEIYRYLLTRWALSALICRPPPGRHRPGPVNFKRRPHRRPATLRPFP